MTHAKSSPYVPAPVESGNTIAVKNGVYSPTLIGAKADDLRPIITEVAPWTAAPEFFGALELYVRTLATAMLGLEYIEQVVADKGYRRVPPRLIETVNAMTNTALRAGSLLGLDGRSKAQIMALSASTETSLASLDRLSETGRAIRQRRQAELQKDEDDSDNET